MTFLSSPVYYQSASIAGLGDRGYYAQPSHTTSLINYAGVYSSTPTPIYSSTSTFSSYLRRDMQLPSPSITAITGGPRTVPTYYHSSTQGSDNPSLAPSHSDHHQNDSVSYRPIIAASSANPPSGGPGGESIRSGLGSSRTSSALPTSTAASVLRIPSSYQPLQFRPVVPRFVLSYSETSGSIFKALREALLNTGYWTDDGAGAKLEDRLDDGADSIQALCRLHLMLGDRYAMEQQIREWAGQLLRAKRRTCDCQGHTTLVNYYPGSKEITLKSNLIRHLRQSERKPYLLTPVTFILKAGSATDERAQFVQKFDSLVGKCENIWILKPSRMNKAMGIRILCDAAEILDHIDFDEEPGEWVVQKYIERPFLIHGRKFDIRTWVVVDTEFNVWLWREGVLRTCSEPYSCDDLDDALVHLSNHCVQETGPNFSAFEHGNEMWYHQFQAYLDQYCPGLNFQEQVVPMMKMIIAACFRSVEAYLTKSTRTVPHELLCYQVFGFDFMLDEDFNTLLIEVNGQPAVAEALLPAFTRDCMELLVRPLFPMPQCPRPGPHNFDLVAVETQLRTPPTASNGSNSTPISTKSKSRPPFSSTSGPSSAFCSSGRKSAKVSPRPTRGRGSATTTSSRQRSYSAQPYIDVYRF